MNQKTAVCECLVRVLEQNEIDYELGGEIPIKQVLSKSMFDEVRREICEGFEEGLISMSDEAKVKYVGHPTEMKKYVNGLVNNWVRKNKEFNNNFKGTPEGKYEIKNPGSRTGSTDESIKNMRLLLKTVTDPTVRGEIQEAIDERIAIISPQYTVKVNAEAIPEHLRHLVK
jgi:hypothetical protein